MSAYSQPGAFSVLTILLLVIPLSRGRHFEELRPSEADVDEVAVEDYSLPSFSELKRQKNAETEAFLTSTELNKRTGGCEIFIHHVCEALSKLSVFKKLSYEERVKTCNLIDEKRCVCSPGEECEYCQYASRK